MAIREVRDYQYFVVNEEESTGKSGGIHYPVGFSPIIPHVGEKIVGKDGSFEVFDVIHETDIANVDGQICKVTIKLKVRKL
jgi:hypothetical protein